MPNICPLCGKLNPDEEWVCEACGTKLPNHGQRAATPPASPPAPPAAAPSQLPPEYAHLQRHVDNVGRGFFTIFIGVAIVFLLFGAASAFKTFQSQSWPSVQGEITYSDIHRQMSTGVTKRNKDIAPSYSPSLRYVYYVNNVRHEGSRVTLLGWSGSASQARAALKPYPKGARVQVYYNPSNHDDALLEPHNQSNNLGAMGMSAVFIVIGVVGCFFWLRKPKRA